MINLTEILNVIWWEERVLNHGKINQTKHRAIIVAAKVWNTDSVRNWRKIPILLPPATLRIPISIKRVDARAIDKAAKFIDAMSIIRKARIEKIHTYLKLLMFLS